MQQLPDKHTKQKSESDLRILPLGVAALICFIVAVSSGSLFWYFFGSKSPYRNHELIITAAHSKPVSSPEVLGNIAVTDNSQAPQTADNSQPVPASSESLTPITAPSPAPATAETPVTNAPAGELQVEGGEVALGGGETKLPIRRESVEPFAIAETEVTNKQFREFVDDTKAKINVPVGKDDEPVTNISWYEAKKYCDWLSKKIGFEVKLPTEAQWELAAGGKENLKYPWGNQWQDEKAGCKENNGKIKPVKSYPSGKSSFGAYDMIGNVWEWTADAGRDELGKITKYKGGDPAFANQVLYVVKGGAAVEGKASNNVQTRISMPLNFRSPDIGFRYVVLRDKAVQSDNSNQ